MLLKCGIFHTTVAVSDVISITFNFAPKEAESKVKTNIEALVGYM